MDPTNRTLSRVVGAITGSVGANVTEEQLLGAARLDDVVPLDSLGLLEFAKGLEDEFAIRFEPERMTRDFFIDLPGLLAYLEEHAATPRQ
ncbi:MAG: hypothetical protein GY953_21080 [bacterium]|nr:hypothetical protein [bacterium]